MDRRERLQSDDLIEPFLAALAGHQAGLWTALPGVVLSYDAASQTVEVQPSIQAIQLLSDGSTVPIDLPPCVDVPVLFMTGGGYTLTFPIKAGDECLIVFASRCIDNWWQLGGDSPQPQAELRMHDLSDGFAIIGPRSQVKMLSPAPITGGVELRSDDRASRVTIDDAGNIFIKSTAANVQVDTGGDILATASGDLIATVGGDANVTVTGSATLVAAAVLIQSSSIEMIGAVTIVGDLVVNGKDVGAAHTHSGGTLSGHTGGVD